MVELALDHALHDLVPAEPSGCTVHAGHQVSNALVEPLAKR
jgi:hypothetical protein